MVTSPQIIRLVDAQAVATERVHDTLNATIKRDVVTFAGWYETAGITAWATRLAAVSEAAQRRIAALTDAYLTRLFHSISGRPVRASGVIPVAGLRQGITHPGVYGRLADQYRYEISTGESPSSATEHVVQRAETIAYTDLALAEQQQEHKFMAVHSVDGWRRVFHPELSKHGSCGLCVAASDRVYSAGDLKPIHANCRCTVIPIINGVDHGSQINDDDLAKIYAEAGSTSAADLKRTRFKVHQHGEIGPVLTAGSAAFRTPAEVAADTRPAA